MAPLSHAGVVFVALAAVGEASVGDRSWLFIDCLDICVEKMCGVTYVREELDFEPSRAEKALQKRLRNRLYRDLPELESSRSEQQPGSAGPPEPTPSRKTGASVAGVPPDFAQPEDRQQQQQQQQWQRRRLLGEAEGSGAGGQDPSAELDQVRRGEEEESQDHHPPQPQRKRQLQQQPAAGAGDKIDPAGAEAAAGGLRGGDGAGGESTGEDVRAAAARSNGPGGTRKGGVEGEARRALTAEEPGGGGEEGTAGVDRYVHQPPWHLRAMGWDCESECRHMCMNLHVDLRAESGSQMVQYYGKWPFRRVWGIQELFASLFSAGNGLPHLYHVLFSKGLYNPQGNYMCFWLTLYPWVGINTWLWSTVFHARDVPWTEAADYFCALLNIFYVVWIALVRLAGPPVKRSPRVRRLMPIVGVSMSVYYLLHISFMWFVKFDYGYNMKVALLAGVAHTGLWLRYLYLVRDRRYAKRGATIIILLNAAILLEVNDFPPLYRLLDAHAIWHFVTIPLMFIWYRFVIQDARHEVSLASKET